MGFKISWLAISGKNKEDVLSLLHLVDSGNLDEVRQSPISVASFPGGWTILFLNPFDHPLAEDRSVQELSMGRVVIVGHVHEGIMYSSARMFRDGKLIWGTSHDSANGTYDIHTEGELPDSFDEIKARLIAKQEEEDADRQMVDYIFNVPVDLAKSICGFEYGRWRYDWGEPHFTEVREQEP